MKRTALAKTTHADDETPLELPSPEEIAERARGLRAASLAAISVADVTALVAAQVKKAKEGDARAAKLVLDYVAAADAKPAPPMGRPPLPRDSFGEPIRLEPAEPPKPVALPGVGTEQYRRLVALHLLAHQPAMVVGIVRLTGLESEQVDALLNHSWFQRDGSTVRLTPAGRNAVG